jgi:hypothetical protein
MNGVIELCKEGEEEKLSLLSLLLLHHFQPSKFIIHRTRTNDRKNKFSFLPSHHPTTENHKNLCAIFFTQTFSIDDDTPKQLLFAVVVVVIYVFYRTLKLFCCWCSEILSKSNFNNISGGDTNCCFVIII